MASLFCPFCGTENPATRQFCLRCASDLRAPVRDPNVPVATEPAATPLRPILIGGAIALGLVVLIIAALVLLGGSPTASPSPAATPSTAPTAASTPAATTAPLPSDAPIDTAVPTLAPSAAGSPAPEASGTPVVDSLKGPRSASCTADNGTGTVGYVHLTWTASNTTGVRLSIDPPAPNTAYDYGYDDYAASGSADVPFTCDPPNSDSVGAYHLYVATTAHDGGYFAWRTVKVYVKA
ncbi:MAG: zinc ribbon domain-containing protein [Chloroflexota bacterium]